MINLIPNEEKKRKVKDFYFRLLIVFFMVLGVSLLISSVAILPAYLFSSVKKKVVETKLEELQKEPVPALDEVTLALSDDLNNKLGMIENEQKNKYLLSQDVINVLVLKKMSDIKINEIIYEQSEAGKIIKINGSAPSRERLLLFRQMLEDDIAFSSVDLPISNFIKGSNISFYLSLVPAQRDI